MTTTLIKSDALSSEQSTATDTPSNESTDDSDPVLASERPLGAQILSAVFDSLTTLSGQIGATMVPLEYPQVREFLTKLGQVLRGCMDDTHSTYTAAYPTDLELQATMDSHDLTLAKFLANSPDHSRPLSNLVQRLRTIETARNLTSSQRAELKRICGHLTKLDQDVQQTSSPNPAVDSHAVDSHAADFAGVKQSIKKLVQRFEDLMPMKRTE